MQQATKFFDLDATDSDSHARAGTLSLRGQSVQTPVFMPVGTQATVKGVLPRDLKDTGATIVLANTYHLLLRPGEQVVAAAGGLHSFMGWSGPILTDSGGFQVFSLAHKCKISDRGVRFRSHIDGSEVMLTPERSIAVQEALGADIIMCFDECPANPATEKDAEAAVRRTLAWAKRCLEAKSRSDQLLFGIQQGGLSAERRAQCTEGLLAHGFPGYAVGGLAVGESREDMYRILAQAAPMLPADRPRYLMGVGKPGDIVEAVACGIDMFDCVMPTRNGRNATVFTFEGRLKLRNARYREDQEPIEAGCDCLACSNFSRSYIRHLFAAKEMLGPTLASLHNLRFYQRLMARIRDDIRNGTFARLREQVNAV